MDLVAYLLTLLSLVATSTAHTYHLGGCPHVDPAPDFDISKFLGKWYVIQKTSTSSKCLVNLYSVNTNESGHYLLEQASQNSILGIYHYTGDLTIPDRGQPGVMRVRFPLSVAGSASYTVLDADPESFALIFSCQSLAIAHRQSASILSRSLTLDERIIEMLHQRLRRYGIDPGDLSDIRQDDCPEMIEDNTRNRGHGERDREEISIYQPDDSEWLP